MAWEEKAPVDDVLLFCECWRTREEIQENFGLTPAESWNCARFIGKLRATQVEHRKGATRRAHMYKTRYYAIKEIRDKRREESA